MVVDFKFKIGEKVLIKDLQNLKGTVVGLYYGETGKQIQTSYFLKGDKKTAYLYEDDLQKIKSSGEFGFVSMEKK